MRALMRYDRETQTVRVRSITSVEESSIRYAASLWSDFEASRANNPVPEYAASQAHGFCDYATKETAVIVVAEDGRAVVGCALGEVFPNRTATLSYLVVQPEARERGIGRQLCDEFAESCLAHGATHVWLTVHETNAAALAFYESTGWNWDGETKPVPMTAEVLRVLTKGL